MPLGTADDATFAANGGSGSSRDWYGTALLQLAPGIEPFTSKKVTVHILAHIASDVLRVPTAALAADAVFVIDDQHVAHRTPIQIGARGEKFVEVAGGLSPSDLIAADSSHLRDGDTVQLSPPAPATQP